MSVAIPRSVASVTVGDADLHPVQVAAVARLNASASLSDSARALMRRSRDHVEELATRKEPVYGISTGFGALANVRVPVESRADLQLGIVRSHAAGIGAPMPREVV